MKNLIKLLIVVTTITITAESVAQTFGVKAGLNLSKAYLEDVESKYVKMNPGFHIGATAEFAIIKIFSIESGLMFTTKGYRVEMESLEEQATGKVNLNYLEIPLTGKALFDVGNLKIYGAFGPYISMGLTGKMKSESTYMGETETTNDDIIWGSDAESDQIKRLDFGLIFGTGVEYKSFQIGLSYDLGLADITPQTGHKITNQVLGISIGYKFRGK